MKNKMVLVILETILFTIVLYVLATNIQAKTTSLFAVSFDGQTVVLSTFLILLIAYFIGIFSGFVYSVVLGIRYKDQIEFYARKNEKLAVQNEIDTDDKEALQRKIATLEIALNNALKNKE